MLFKVDGNWFGLYSDKYNDNNNGVSDYVGTSMIMQAFATNYTVKIKANHGWDSNMSACGDTGGQAIHIDRGDYLQIIK